MFIWNGKSHPVKNAHFLKFRYVSISQLNAAVIRCLEPAQLPLNSAINAWSTLLSAGVPQIKTVRERSAVQRDVTIMSVYNCILLVLLIHSKCILSFLESHYSVVSSQMLASNSFRNLTLILSNPSG